MTRTKMLLAAAASAAVLAGVGVPTVVLAANGPVTIASSQSAPTTPGIGQQCGYPSSRKPNLTLIANPTSIRRGASTTLSGTLTGNKCAITKRTIQLFARPSGSTGAFVLVGTTTTSDKGGYTFPAQKPTVTTDYRTMFAGDANYDPVTSPIVTVTVK